MGGMKTYLVGGAVRDRLLGLEPGDRDWVVVGETQASMEAAGFKPVGRDFPVFLHPATGEEHALARTERKSGRGYRGFVVDADPTVTLEEDLGRRDFTINAIAQDVDGQLVDPFGGAADIEARVLRHVGDAFVEDPLRVLRADARRPSCARCTIAARWRWCCPKSMRCTACPSVRSTTRKWTPGCTWNWFATWPPGWHRATT